MDSKQSSIALGIESGTEASSFAEQTTVVPLDRSVRRSPRLQALTRHVVPFYRPYVVGTEHLLVEQAIRSLNLSGDGPLTVRCSQILQESLQVQRALLTTSCTHALEMSALLLEIEPGDEVIMPSYTFVSTANAFVLRGAKPVFAEIRPDTLNIDERVIESLISCRTRAIVVVHYAGVGCEMDAILQLAARYGIPVIEDNAHGLFGKYRGRYLGTLGALGTQSFHGTKNFTCGEGGALLFNDARYIERAEVIREKGTNRSRFFRGEVDKYTWRDLGSSYLPSDLLAAFLVAQLEARDFIQERRRSIWDFYEANLAAWARSFGVSTPHVPDGVEPAYHLYYLVMRTAVDREGLISHLRDCGIQATSHYQPLHTSDMGKRLGYAPGDLPVTEEASECIVRLPLFCDMTVDQLAYVVDSVRSFEPCS
jgi:dTDP-4-amino-4,6-dideoxygalactose transaminase